MTFFLTTRMQMRSKRSHSAPSFLHAPPPSADACIPPTDANGRQKKLGQKLDIGDFPLFDIFLANRQGLVSELRCQAYQGSIRHDNLHFSFSLHKLRMEYKISFPPLWIR